MKEQYRELEDDSIEKEWEDGRKLLSKSRYLAEQKTWRSEEEEQNEYIEEERELPIKVVARFRLRSENRSSKYWEKSEEKICRLCREEKETLEHIFEKCEWTRCGKKAKEAIRQDNR